MQPVTSLRTHQHFHQHILFSLSSCVMFQLYQAGCFSTTRKVTYHSHPPSLTPLISLSLSPHISHHPHLISFHFQTSSFSLLFYSRTHFPVACCPFTHLYTFPPFLILVLSSTGYKHFMLSCQNNLSVQGQINHQIDFYGFSYVAQAEMKNRL